jgi:hypothetical protein
MDSAFHTRFALHETIISSKTAYYLLNHVKNYFSSSGDGLVQAETRMERYIH